jgi:hypothetical protein
MSVASLRGYSEHGFTAVIFLTFNLSNVVKMEHIMKKKYRLTDAIIDKAACGIFEDPDIQAEIDSITQRRLKLKEMPSVGHRSSSKMWQWVRQSVTLDLLSNIVDRIPTEPQIYH